MNTSAYQQSIASPVDIKTNKCALKLIGIDFGHLTDEEVLEFISNYVQPSAISGLFYDTYNSFYVLHLNDIESTSLLIGKTLQIGTYKVTFLPLLDCFVIENVYLSISNKRLREIFMKFGNVFEVENCHVLPNSSKFFHVLSGTREITFLLPGADCEVQIPMTVYHPPYTFIVKHYSFCCLTKGHSLLNCPDREENNSSLPKISKIHEKNVVINILGNQENGIGEMTFEESKEGVDGKPMEIVSSNVTNIKEEVSEKNEELIKQTSNDNSLGVKKIEKPKKNVKMTINKNRSKGSKKSNPSSDNSVSNFQCSTSLTKINLDIPPSVKTYIMQSVGAIPTDALLELLYIDGRNRGNILAFVLKFTSDVRAVLDQLRKLKKELGGEVESLSVVEHKFMQKICTIIKILKKFLQI